MGSLKRRVHNLQEARMRREGQLARQRLSQLTDQQLDELAESLGLGAEPNEYLEQMKEWELEAIEQQRRNAEESRRWAKKGATK